MTRMPFPTRRLAAAAVAAGALLVGAGCGADESAPGDQRAAAKHGGKLTVRYSGDVDFLDPGLTYYNAGYFVAYATQRPLVNFRPEDSETPVPDLAAKLPEVSKDGRTVTVRLRRGVKFSPPVSREVTSADVRYAIERGFFATVQNPYAPNYFGDIVGAKPGAAPGTRIKGIETPDEHTIVFRLSQPSGGVLASALSLPLSVPVPEEYAARFDRKGPSTYDGHVVATGPYMVRNDARGKVVGREPGKRIELVRNPSWDRATDYKPAYLDEIEIVEGNNDGAVASRQILSGSAQVNGDVTPPPAVLREAATRRNDQLQFVSPGSIAYVALNTSLAPFDDANVRKAVLAGFDRDRMRRVVGGESRGPLATHFLPPGVPGHAEAGGAAGPGADFLRAPRGDDRLAAEYFRAAGFESGRYEGDEEILVVGVSDSLGKPQAEVTQAELEQLGFKVKLRLVSPEAYFTKFCPEPGAKIHVCAPIGWFRDFPDGQTVLEPLFDGASIQPHGNTNISQLKVPAVDAAMEAAEKAVDPAARARAWGQVDRLVTAQAPGVPLTWDQSALVRSADVAGVANKFFAGWDLTYTSLR
jgi:peptide/nickel transport system substrate-binding protein